MTTTIPLVSITLAADGPTPLTQQLRDEQDAQITAATNGLSDILTDLGLED